jgi:hypothetical protein
MPRPENVDSRLFQQGVAWAWQLNQRAGQVDFESEEDALAYAIHVQRDRRNMTDAALLQVVRDVHEPKRPGRPIVSHQDELGASAPNKPAASVTASKLGTSPDRVKKALAVDRHADDQTKQEVKEGKKTINADAFTIAVPGRSAGRQGHAPETP